jgi:hypothetical protein
MTSLPCPDPFETRLRGFIAELSACTTTDERDQVLGNIADEVRVILNSHPGLTRRWPLGLDRVNRRFAVSSVPHEH